MVDCKTWYGRLIHTVSCLDVEYMVCKTIPNNKSEKPKKFKLVTKMEIKSVVSNSISDAAALSVAAHLGTHDEEVIVELPEVDNENGSDETKVQDKPPITSRVCDMHNLSKILAWALGTLLKSKGKKVRYSVIRY